MNAYRHKFPGSLTVGSDDSRIGIEHIMCVAGPGDPVDIQFRALNFA